MTSYHFKNKLTYWAFLSALSISLFALETLIPKPLPFIKPGFANSITLFLIFQKEFKAAFVVSITKVIIGNFLVGMIFSPAFVLSFVGTVFSVIFMMIFYKININFSILGISIIGALMHNLSQIAVARFLLIKDNSIFLFIPLMILLSVVTGILSGYFAHYIKNIFNEWGILKYEKIS